MVEETAPADAAGTAQPPRRRSRARRAAKWGGGGVLVVVLGLIAAVLLLDSQIGHRFILDRIAGLAPKSGLRIEVGRIEGSIYNSATLHDVVLKDPEGTFMTVPEAELDWR
ncbi:MAG: hypothetical protein ABW194_11130, partial [Novosphingobium sp.]